MYYYYPWKRCKISYYCIISLVILSVYKYTQRILYINWVSNWKLIIQWYGLIRAISAGGNNNVCWQFFVTSFTSSSPLRSIKSVVRMFDIRTHFTDCHHLSHNRGVVTKWRGNISISSNYAARSESNLNHFSQTLTMGVCDKLYPPCVRVLWLIATFVTIVFVTAWHSWHRAHYNRYCDQALTNQRPALGWADQSEARTGSLWADRGNKAIYLYWSHSRSLARYIARLHVYSFEHWICMIVWIIWKSRVYLWLLVQISFISPWTLRLFDPLCFEESEVK